MVSGRKKSESSKTNRALFLEWWIACSFLKSKPQLLVLGFIACSILKMCCVLASCWFHHKQVSSPDCLTHWNKGKRWLLSVDSIKSPGLHSQMQSPPQSSYTLYILWPGSDGQLSRWPIFCQSIRLNEQKHSMNASFAVFNVRRADLTFITVASFINKRSCIWKHKFCISAQTQKRRINHRACYSCAAQRERVPPPTPLHPASPPSCIPNRSTVFHPHYGHTTTVCVCSCHRAGDDPPERRAADGCTLTRRSSVAVDHGTLSVHVLFKRK